MSTSTAPAASTTSATPLVITSFPSIPLTETFTRPASNCGGIYLPATPGVFIIDDQPSCLPSGFSTSNPSFYYSPGIACPSGYWTACHDTTGVASITTVTCCPTIGDISLSCVPTPQSLSSVWASLYCTWIAPESPGTVITATESGDGRTSTVTAQMSDPEGVNAYGIRMVYQATDLLQTTTTSSSTKSAAASTASSTATAAPANTSTSSSPSADSSTSTGLSTGAKTAIGVVVPLVVIAVITALLVIWWRRRRQQQQQQHQQPTASPGQEYGYNGGTSEVLGSTPVVGYTDQPQQQHQKAPQYYYGGAQEVVQGQGAWQQHPAEMPSTRAAAELPGDGLVGEGGYQQTYEHYQK